MATWQVPSRQDVDRRVRIAGRRQAVLQQQESRPRLRLSLVIDEAVLHRAVAAAPGTPRAGTIRLDQLDRLAVAGGWPNVTIQVLPYSAGIPPVSAGSFSLLESRATGTPDVVYLENKSRFFFIDAETEVDRYAKDFALLTKLALPPEESVDFIRSVVRTLRAPSTTKRAKPNAEPRKASDKNVGSGKTVPSKQRKQPERRFARPLRTEQL